MIGSTYIIDQGNTLYVHMLPIKCILQQLDYIVANRILRREAFGPGQNFPRA